jgi:predicted alpha/beta hydrolase family esterase
MDFVLIPGAGGRAWYWHLVARGLTEREHRAVAVELPADDDTQGLPDYAHAVVEAAAAAAGEVVVVAASLGAFTAPLVVGPLQVAAMVLVNPMIPLPGETPGDWWGDTGAVEARCARASRLGYPVEFDAWTYMFHDVAPEVLATVTPKGEQSRRPFQDPCTFTAWPDATTVISAEDDRFFPVEFQQQLARRRLGVEPVVVPGGHLVALGHPDELTSAILAATGGT